MDDLIDRKEAIKVISNDSLDVKCFCVIGRRQGNRELAKTINDYVDLVLETAKRKILSLPKADTERHAHWELIDNDIDTFVYRCSNCKDTIALPFGMIKEFKGCPYCLSRMDEVINNE